MAMDKTKIEKDPKQPEKHEVACALFGCKVCPHPQECDGLHRLCNIWRNHSGR